MSTELFKPSPQPWQPHAYQKRAIKFLLEHAAAALFLDPGLGKTSITLAALKLLKKRGATKTLIIAPKRAVYSVWPAELEKWEDFGGLTVALLHGKGKDAALEQDADLYVINPDGLEWLLGLTKERTPTGRTRVTVDMKRWKALGFDNLVIDELSKFKHPHTQRFKALKQVLHTFDRRWGLTGSPVANGLIDLFGQCYALDEGRTLGKYVTHYRNQFFTPSFDGYSWDLKEGAEEAIYQRVKPLALRMAAGDYLEMPTLIENNIRVDLPEAAMNIYEELEEELFVQIEQKVVVAANAAAASTKCRQVANGGIYVTDAPDDLAPRSSKREWIDLHTAKVDALADLIDELQGSPLLVAYDFQHDLARLQERLGAEVPYVGGNVSDKRGAELVKMWNAGKLPVLLGHPAAMAHGLNLQEAGCHVAWHSLTWNYEWYDQFIRRVWRQGNRNRRVFVHHLLARGTIDETVLGALRAKKRGQQAFFAALVSRRRNKYKLTA